MAEGTEAAIKSIRKIFGSVQGEGEAEADPEAEGGSTGPAVGEVYDLPQLNKHVFNAAGVELGEYGALILMKQLKQLSATTGASSVKFWGKIFGTQKDYYVVEVNKAQAGLEEPTLPEGCEARGEQGVNMYSYFVANAAQGPWVALPDLEPVDLKAARAIKVSFTGELEREIVTNPFYFKTEKYFLRAQIARISHSCKLVPAGENQLEETEAEGVTLDLQRVKVAEDENEEFKRPKPTAQSMCNKTMWVHYPANILRFNKV